MSAKPIYLISFNQRDEHAATYLQRELLRIFRDRVEFRISTRIRFENWRDWIRRTLAECRGVIALWSKYSLPSKWIYVEVGVCAYEGKRLFNLVLDIHELPRFRETPFSDEQAHVLSADTLHDLVEVIGHETGVDPSWDQFDAEAMRGRMQDLLDSREEIVERLKVSMRKSSPRFFATFSDEAFHVLYFGTQYFPGLKRGATVEYNANDNTVDVRGAITDDVPSFGATVSQSLTPRSHICFRVTIREIGKTSWSDAFFRVDVDDVSGRRLSLRAIEPRDATAENDWYVKLPSDASDVLYTFPLPGEFTKLTRLQIVLAPNDRYDLTFRDFAVVEL